MGEPRRPDRVAEAIREEVATFLAEGAKDPRIRAFVTVTAVDVTRDLRHATVFVSLLGDDADKQSTLEGLASVASYLRSQLGRSLRLRSAPEIHFKTDQSVAHATRIEQLLAQIRTEREEHERDAVAEPAPESDSTKGDSTQSDLPDSGPPASGES